MYMTLLDILKGISIPDQLGIYEESDGFTASTENYIDEVLREAKLNNLNVSYYSGASQLVFIENEDTANRVYKLPFDGMIREWSEYNEEIDDYDWKEEWENYKTNYTAKTLELYNSAIEEEVNEFFADIKKEAFSFNHCVIYSQAFVVPRNAQTKSTHPSEDSLNKAKKIREKKYIPFTVDWVAVCIEMYGENKFNQLLNFINEYDIRDLHQGNYGFTRDGKPMILDYSSFNE